VSSVDLQFNRPICYYCKEFIQDENWFNVTFKNISLPFHTGCLRALVENYQATHKEKWPKNATIN
jgi:hypothetical protein